MTLNEMRKLERTLEEMNIDIDTIIFFIYVAQRELNGLA